MTGIMVPIGLSYILQPLLDATAIQAFAAGAALCSTSLGTTFTVLASSGLSSTRLGVVLTSAAMLDDVVGLVMVQVISNLGGSDVSAVTIVRPVLVSVAFAVVVPLICRFCIKPSGGLLMRYQNSNPEARLSQLLRYKESAFVVHTGLLIGLVAGSSYAGTSNLFAAYIAGAVISWWDSEIAQSNEQRKRQAEPKKTNSKKADRESDVTMPAAASSSTKGDEIHMRPIGTRVVDEEPEENRTSHEQNDADDERSGVAIYERYYKQAVARILQPLFFASIGFSIPITRMFQGSIVWRGIVYAILMTLAKLVCGLWLVRFSVTPLKSFLSKVVSRVKRPSIPRPWGKKSKVCTGRAPSAHQVPPTRTTSDSRVPPASKPFSLHPPLILACAMTARGEIGFLVSAVAESTGVFASNNATPGMESDVFLVVTWAIVLCTILGPLGVGFSVRRVKTLEERKNREQQGSGRDVLGVWGVGRMDHEEDVKQDGSSSSPSQNGAKATVGSC